MIELVMIFGANQIQDRLTNCIHEIYVINMTLFLYQSDFMKQKHIDPCFIYVMDPSIMESLLAGTRYYVEFVSFGITLLPAVSAHIHSVAAARDFAWQSVSKL